MNIFTLDLEMLKPSCTFGTGILISYTWKLLLICSAVATLFATAYVSRKIFSHASYWHMGYKRTFNTFGTLYQAIFVALSLLIIQPVRTFENPDGTWAMMKAPHIEFGSPTYIKLTVITSVAFFGMVVTFFVGERICRSWRKFSGERQND